MSTRMGWDKLLTAERFAQRSGHVREEIGRTPFHKDHDRIVFSEAFRRLSRKTQVHPLSRNDHVHTRLTHSLEVGCVGRSLGMRVGELLRDELPAWITPADIGVIVQAACLAHDIGNPPFGHAGEYAIRDWLHDAQQQWLLDGLSAAEHADLAGFDGNAQGLRLLTRLEYHLFHGGMRLTYATLGAFMKYPWLAGHAAAQQQHGDKFGCYRADHASLTDIADTLGLLATGSEGWCRHPLAYLVEAADDICYALLDLEDGREMGILRLSDIEPLFLRLSGERPHAVPDAASERRYIAQLRGAAMEHMVNAISDAFVQQHEALLTGRLPHHDLLHFTDPVVADSVQEAKQMARERIFLHQRKAELELGAHQTLSILLRAFFDAVRARHLGQTGNFRQQRLLTLMGNAAPTPELSLYESYLRVLDYISGMTDNYAVELAAGIQGLSAATGARDGLSGS